MNDQLVQVPPKELEEALAAAFPTLEAIGELENALFHGRRFGVAGVVDLKHLRGTIVGSFDRKDSLLRHARMLNRDNQQIAELARTYAPWGDYPEAEIGPLFDALTRLNLSYEAVTVALDPEHYVELRRNEPCNGLMFRAMEILAEVDAARRPLLSFAEKLAAQGEPSVSKRVHISLARIRQQLGIAALAPAAPGPPRELHVLFRLDLTDDPRLFEYVVWVVDAEGTAVATPIHSPAPRNLEAVKEDLKTLFRNELARHRSGRLTFEFILPRALWCEPVDCWEVTQGKVIIPIGEKHPVVLRSYERLYDQTRSGSEHDWRGKWNRMCAAAGGDSGFVWLEKTALSPEEMVELRRRFLREDTFGFVSHEPPQTPPASPLDFVDLVVDLGIGLGVWVRHGQRDPRLRELLSRSPLDLPDAVLAERQGLPLGPHIVLFWDDPRRKPPDLQADSIAMAPPTR